MLISTAIISQGYLKHFLSCCCLLSQLRNFSSICDVSSCSYLQRDGPCGEEPQWYLQLLRYFYKCQQLHSDRMNGIYCAALCWASNIIKVQIKTKTTSQADLFFIASVKRHNDCDKKYQIKQVQVTIYLKLCLPERT